MFDYIGRFKHAISALKHEQRYRVFADLERRARTPHCDDPVALRSRRWLKPYTDETIKSLAANGAKRIAVVTQGLSADCLDMIEEIGTENATYIFAEGGEAFARIDCLNDSRMGMSVIEAIVRRELSGWI